jgi:heat shock protein HslJ
MRSTRARVTALLVAMSCLPAIGRSQGRAAGWLDNPRPTAWNTPAQTIPPAPKIQGAVDARCRDAARPPQLVEDKQVRERGWDLVGAFHGGWQIVVIRATAGYDGMCRPRQYQNFVFVRGVFAGTLSPQPMDGRTDGALTRVSLESGTRLTAEYARYATSDALCCPSRTTNVIFEVTGVDRPIVRPVSTSTSNTATAQAGNQSSAPSPSRVLTGTSWQLVKFQSSDDSILKPDDPSKYTIEFADRGQLTARIDCNRGRGTWKSAGSSQIEFGPLALTRAQCPPGSLHDQIVKQWGNIRSYVIRDGHLFLALMADGGIYEFEPVGRSK